MTPVSPSGINPLDALLAAYSVGSLDPATHALVSTHLLLKPDNRAFVAACEEIASHEFEDLSPAPLRDRNQQLDAIFASAPPSAPIAAPPTSTSLLPAPLRRFVGGDVNELKFRTLLPGVREHRIAGGPPGGGALLYWVRAGRSIPSHTHEGMELTLVLQGAFSDITGRYARGDIAIGESDLDHQPITERDEDCLCFAVMDAPVHLTGPVGRILDRLFGPRGG